MKYLIVISLFLCLSACGIMTGNPVKDCLTARNAVITAQSLATLTSVIALANPTSNRDGQAASLAQAALTQATATEVSVCSSLIP